MIPKFRIWDKNLEELYDVEEIKYMYNNLVGKTDAFFYYDNKECFRSLLLNDCENEVMQFTGMFDKNGKEIYEGDVVEILKYHDLYDNLLKSSIKFTGLVDFDEGQWKIISKKGTLPLFSKNTEIEILGHKYMEEYQEFLNERL